MKVSDYNSPRFTRRKFSQKNKAANGIIVSFGQIMFLVKLFHFRLLSSTLGVLGAVCEFMPNTIFRSTECAKQ